MTTGQHVFLYDPEAVAVPPHGGVRWIDPDRPPLPAFDLAALPPAERELLEQLATTAPVSGRYRLGAPVCTACGMLESFAIFDTLPDGTPGPCPGPRAPAPDGAVLPGTPPLGGPGRPDRAGGAAAGGCHPDGDSEGRLF